MCCLRLHAYLTYRSQWWAVWDEQACSPPKLSRTQWKYPSCDVGFKSPLPDYSEADLNSEGREIFATETDGNQTWDVLSAINDTCWNPTQPMQMPDCPFTAIDNNTGNSVTDTIGFTSERTWHSILQLAITRVTCA